MSDAGAWRRDVQAAPADVPGRVSVSEEREMKRPIETRTRVMRALHAEGAKRGLDHEGLREMCRGRFGVASMGDLDLAQAASLYKDVTGTEFLVAGQGPAPRVKLPERGYAARGETQIVSGGELELLERAFAKRGWGPATKSAFIRRQLRGREQIRTRADFQRVFRGVQAMNRRDGKGDYDLVSAA